MTGMTCVCGHETGEHKWGGSPLATGPVKYGFCFECDCREFRDREQFEADLEVASRAALTRVPGLFGEYDHWVEVHVSRVEGVQAGDYAAVREAKAAEPGQTIVAKASDGKYTLAEAPVGDGLTVEGVVVGVWRPFDV